MVGVATVAAVIGVAGSARGQVTPGPRRVAPAAAPTDPSDTWDKHTSLGLELGPGGVLTAYDRNQSPSALLFYTSLRASYDLKPQWSGGLTLRQWWLPGSNHATMFGLTARFEPVIREVWRAYADVAIGATTTDYAWAFGFDLGGGAEWNIPDAAGLAIGPYLRYGQVLNPDQRTNSDGRAWTLGGAFTYHFGRAAAGAKPEAGARRGGGGYRLSVPDSDRDGVGDDQDLCRNAPQGNHPDPFKPGCPENDEDGDEVPDVDDACPVTVPGQNPDPKRPGCPLIDTDKDGIADPDDACPLKAGPATSDPAHYGCPTDKKRSAAPEEAPPASEPANAPSTVRKKRMK
jgi:thrombospondin type 3 repeat protein